MESVESYPSITAPPLLKSSVQLETPDWKVVLCAPKNGVLRLAVLPSAVHVPPRVVAVRARKKRCPSLPMHSMFARYVPVCST
jgi:hypothetical protein